MGHIAWMGNGGLKTTALVAFALATTGLSCGDDTAGPLVCPAVPVPKAGAPFSDATDRFGLTASHHFATDFCKLPDTIGGPGVCLFDYDRDGDIDVYFADRAPFGNSLWRNDGGTSLVDVSASSGDAASVADTMGCLAFDYDGDGDEDLYLTNNGPDQLLRNDGDSFADVTTSVGLVADGFSVSAAAGDIDADGDLDLFVGRVVDLASCPDECSIFPAVCDASTNLLLENRNGQFFDVSVARGIVEAAPSLTAAFVDLNEDGDVDLYVGNDMGILFSDHYYDNDGNGNFTEESQRKGLNALGTDTMGVDFGDIDDDGDTDLITSDFKDRPLRRFDCNGGENPCNFGSVPDGGEYVKWAVSLTDFDHDGDLDLFSSTGDVGFRDGNPSYLYFNQGAGSFLLHTPSANDPLSLPTLSRGAGFGDLDNDGDIDVVLANAGGRHQILLNEAAAGHALQLLLPPGSAGARVTVQSIGGSADGAMRTEHVLVGAGYAGSNDPRMHVGLGDACEANVTVRFVGGGSVTERVNTVDGPVTIRR